MQLSSVYWTTNLGNPRANHKLIEYTEYILDYRENKEMEILRIYFYLSG